MFSGAIFTEDQKDSPSELAFKYAVYKINKEKVLLPNTTMVYDIQYVPKDDSFRTSKKGQFECIVHWPRIHLTNTLSLLVSNRQLIDFHYGKILFDLFFVLFLQE